jgi:branched-chain amino acid transport system substrate-binding protein
MRSNKNQREHMPLMKQVLGILLLLLLASCTTQNEAIKIGGAFSLSGDAADWGNDELKATQLAIDEANAEGGINGVPIKLVVEDTATDAKGTLNAVQKLISVDEVQVIIGPTWADSFAQIIGPVAEENKVVILTPSGAVDVAEAERDLPYFFSTFYPQRVEMETHMKFLKERGYKRVAVLYDQDPFDTAVAEEYMRAAKEMGVETFAFEVPTDTKDYRTVLAKAREQNPDHIFAIIFEVGNYGAMLKNMHELGMNLELSSTASAQTNELLENYGQYAEGKVYFATPDLSSNAYKEFEKRFTEKYGQPPSGATAANAYDATRIVITALRSGARSGSEIKASLDTISIAGTFVDEIDFTENGQIETAAYTIKTVRNQTYAELS